MQSAAYFNVDNGFLEGVARGFRSGILNQAQYLNLTQCETLEGGAAPRVAWIPCLADLP